MRNSGSKGTTSSSRTTRNTRSTPSTPDVTKDYHLSAVFGSQMGQHDEERSVYAQIGTEIGALVTEKNAAYGSSFNHVADFLAILYPTGVAVAQYADMLCLARIFDKMMRIANRKHAFNESPYEDIAGYGILGAALDRAREKSACRPLTAEQLNAALGI